MRFRNKLLVLFGGLAFLSLALLIVVSLLRLNGTAESRINQSLVHAQEVFERAKKSRAELVNDAVASLAASNPELRSVLGTFSESDNDPFAASSTDSSSTSLNEAHDLLKSSLPFLPLYEKNQVFVVVNKKGELLFEKQDFPREGSIDLSSLPIVSETLAGKGSYDWWRPEENEIKPFLPAGAQEGSVYQIFSGPVTMKGVVYGAILVGNPLDAAELKPMEEISRTRIEIVNSESPIPESGILALQAEILAPSGRAVGRFVISRSKAEEMQEYRQLQWQLLLLSVLVLMATIGAVLYISRAVTQPLRLLTTAVKEIKRGNFRYKVEIPSRDEFGDLGGLVNDMSEGLEERDKIKSTFRQYVDDQVVDEILKTSGEIKLGGEEKELTIFFSDIASFTQFSEKESPQEVMGFLNRYFTLMSGLIDEEKGIIDKFIGDAIMAFWGAPLPIEDHAVLACRAALRQREAFRKFKEENPKLANSGVDMRIGINTGQAVVGNVGSERRINYTVIGDSVNLASRVEGLNKAYGTGICVTESTRSKLGSAFVLRELDSVRVVGKAQPIRIFELVAEAGTHLSDLQKDAILRYEGALAMYRQREFSAAKMIFDDLYEKDPTNKAAYIFSGRAGKYIDTLPPDSWDGVWSFSEK